VESPTRYTVVAARLLADDDDAAELDELVVLDELDEFEELDEPEILLAFVELFAPGTVQPKTARAAKSKMKINFASDFVFFTLFTLIAYI